MIKTNNRRERVAAQIQEELAWLIRKELQDPRVGQVTVSAVVLSPDYSQAKVYITIYPSDADIIKRNLDALNHAAGFLRTQLAQRLQMRTQPRLRFFYDDSTERADRLTTLIHQATKEYGDAANH